MTEPTSASLLSTLIMFFIIIIFFVLNIYLAFRFDKQHRATNPESPSMKWFFYYALPWAWIGIVGVLTGIYSLIANLNPIGEILAALAAILPEKILGLVCSFSNQS
jgi:hypothetical protein